MENVQKIRVSRGIVIEVNDAGETITLNVEDTMFLDHVTLMIERTKGRRARIDDIFGADTCRKVFGDTVPGPYMIADFFDQLMPIAEKYMDERQKEIGKKYNRTRRGARRV